MFYRPYPPSELGGVSPQFLPLALSTPPHYLVCKSTVPLVSAFRGPCGVKHGAPVAVLCVLSTPSTLDQLDPVVVGLLVETYGAPPFTVYLH